MSLFLSVAFDKGIIRELFEKEGKWLIQRNLCVLKTHRSRTIRNSKKLSKSNFAACQASSMAHREIRS